VEDEDERLNMECCYCGQLLSPCSFPASSDEVLPDTQQTPNSLSLEIDTCKRVVSGVLTGLAGCLVCVCLWNGKRSPHEVEDTGISDRHPTHTRLVKSMTVLMLMAAIFFLEGMQIAVLASSTLHLDEVPVRFSRCRFLLGALSPTHTEFIADSCDTVKRFLIGRQLLVVVCMFGLASVTSPEGSHFPALESNGFSQLQTFLTFVSKSGLATIIFVLNTVQLPSQLFAKKFPLSFLNTPGCYSVLRASLVVESTGVCYLGWMLFSFMKTRFARQVK
jgi:hypothetical protein